MTLELLNNFQDYLILNNHLDIYIFKNISFRAKNTQTGSSAFSDTERRASGIDFTFPKMEENSIFSISSICLVIRCFSFFPSGRHSNFSDPLCSDQRYSSVFPFPKILHSACVSLRQCVGRCNQRWEVQKCKVLDKYVYMSVSVCTDRFVVACISICVPCADSC